VTGFPKAVRDIILTRAQNHCEVCGVNAPNQLHHRRARGMGSTIRPETNRAANGLAACADCHRQIESRREFALDRGWLVRQNQTPADVPVVHHGSWALLSDDGAVFRPPVGRGRCVRCGCHEVQGHRSGCQERGVE